MSPQVEAAIIAGSFGVLTLILTVAAQFYGIRRTSRDTKETRKQQSDQLDKTLNEQRTRTLNERFSTAADKLGSDKPPAVRLAGVHAMAGLADDWPENRQTCVDVLCAYLRLPYDPDPGEGAELWAAYRANREVRHTIIRLIASHLRPDAKVSWQGLNLDFTGVVFDGGDFSKAIFSSTVKFTDAVFSGGTVWFADAVFSGGQVYFDSAKFSGGHVRFYGAKFSGGDVVFVSAEFSGGEVGFRHAKFSGSDVGFFRAKFSGSKVDFSYAEFSGGTVYFHFAQFSGGMVGFGLAEFSGGTVGFAHAEFSGGMVDFAGSEFSGGDVGLFRAKFSGGEVDFRYPGDWSQPPVFGWEGTPPAGVMLPADADAPPA
jgi:ribosomal protein L29